MPQAKQVSELYGVSNKLSFCEIDVSMGTRDAIGIFTFPEIMRNLDICFWSCLWDVKLTYLF